MSEKKNGPIFHKIGAVLRKKDQEKPGVYVVLGNSKATNEKYRTTVELTLKDSNGNVVASTSNGFLTVQDPRKRPGITEEQRSKINDLVVSELFLVQDGE